MTVYETRLSNVMRAMNREKTDYIPTLAFPGPGNAAYMGKSALEAAENAQAYCDAFNGVYKDMWCDCSMDNGIITLPRVGEIFGDGVQYFFGADNTTVTHLQKSPMKEDEYPQLIADPDKFVNDVLLPRKFPWIYENPKATAEKIKEYFEVCGMLFFEYATALTEDLEKNYEVVNLCGAGYVTNPVDTLFDSLRGFRGTITDMRRHPDLVKDALEAIWNTKDGFVTQMPVEMTFPYFEQMPHMPAYMSAKQFEQFYWPYEKRFIDYMAEGGSKNVILLEGSWKHVIDSFRDVPKDSCLLMSDDDDIIDLKKWIGDYQLITGGAKLVEIRQGDLRTNLDRAKRVCDACGADGGFIFGTDKNWISPGDVNKTLVEVYNFVHDYKG